MKKVIAFFKSLFAAPVEPVVAPAPVVVEAPKAKKEVVVAEEAAPKKKKRYYKPKNKA
jgi:hypothetical protein